MITQECEIYVENKGFVNIESVSPGDRVYTLTEKREVWLEPVDRISSDFFSGKINCIDSGAHNVDVTNDARLFYYSETFGSKLISFQEIPSQTPNKEYSLTKYLPVLAWKEQSPSRRTELEIEAVARQVTVNKVDKDFFRRITEGISGTDALLLIDMLEFWLSESPGIGWFERASVKSRSHNIADKYILDELCKVAVMAGCTAATTVFPDGTYGLKISYESMPIPGSRPKNEKYHPKYFTGNVYNLSAKNRPILGRSRNRAFYLPTTSVLQDDIM